MELDVNLLLPHDISRSDSVEQDGRAFHKYSDSNTSNL